MAWRSFYDRALDMPRKARIDASGAKPLYTRGSQEKKRPS